MNDRWGMTVPAAGGLVRGNGTARDSTEEQGKGGGHDSPH